MKNDDRLPEFTKSKNRQITLTLYLMGRARVHFSRWSDAKSDEERGLRQFDDSLINAPLARVSASGKAPDYS